MYICIHTRLHNARCMQCVLHVLCNVCTVHCMLFVLWHAMCEIRTHVRMPCVMYVCMMLF